MTPSLQLKSIYLLYAFSSLSTSSSSSSFSYSFSYQLLLYFFLTKIKEIHSFSVKKTLDLPSLAALEKKITLSILPVRSRLLGKLSKKNVEVQSTGDHICPVLSCPGLAWPAACPVNLSCPACLAAWLAVYLPVLPAYLPACLAVQPAVCMHHSLYSSSHTSLSSL